MRNVLIAVMAFFFVLPVVSACGEDTPQAGYELPVEDLTIETAAGQKHRFHVEIAATVPAQMKGLMGRESMPEDHGMLFLFAVEKEHSFWMKNTLLPLDIIYIKSNGVINHIHENAKPMDETPLLSNGPVLNVLELNGGMTAKLGIKPGDKVYHGSFGKALAP